DGLALVQAKLFGIQNGDLATLNANERLLGKVAQYAGKVFGCQVQSRRNHRLTGRKRDMGLDFVGGIVFNQITDNALRAASERIRFDIAHQLMQTPAKRSQHFAAELWPSIEQGQQTVAPNV